MSRPNLILDFSAPQPMSFIPSPEIMITTPSKEYLRPAFDEEGYAPSPMNVVPKTPRTPLRKLDTAFGQDTWGEHTFSSDEDEEMTRPSSAASMYSSSSACSYGSMTSFNSVSPSGCLDNDDPFMSKEINFEEQPKTPNTPRTKDAYLSSTRRAREPRSRQQLEKSDSAKDTDWSEETDAHLWTTYNRYKNDPKVTPFYVPSGGVPPLGVCCRVSREAKRTWKVSRNLINEHNSMLSPVARGSRPRTNSNSLMVNAPDHYARRLPRSGNGKRKIMPAKWQYSESATRQRLRLLCRRKSNDPHHQEREQLSEPFGIARPIPFPALTGPPTSSLSEFSSRSMTVSLIASTAESMRPNGPLATITAGMDNGNQFPQPMPLELLGQFDLIPSGPEAQPQVTQFPGPIPENSSLESIPEAPQQVVVRSNSGRRNGNAHRRSGSRGNVLHRKMEPSNVTGHRRNTSCASTTNSVKAAVEKAAAAEKVAVVEKEEVVLPVVRKRTRVRSSSDASGSLRSIPRMLCLGAAFGAVEEGEEATQPSARRLHKRHQSLPVGPRGGAPPSLMPAIEFTAAESKQQAKKPDSFFDDLFGKHPEHPENSTNSTPASNAGPVRVSHRKMRSRGLSFGERSRKSEGLLQPPSIAENVIAEDSPSKRHGMLRRLGSPFRETEPVSIASCTESVPLPAPAVNTTEVASALASGFVSPPPRKHRRDGSATPHHRERSILGLNLGFFLGRRSKKE